MTPALAPSALRGAARSTRGTSKQPGAYVSCSFVPGCRPAPLWGPSPSSPFSTSARGASLFASAPSVLTGALKGKEPPDPSVRENPLLEARLALRIAFVCTDILGSLPDPGRVVWQQLSGLLGWSDAPLWLASPCWLPSVVSAQSLFLPSFSTHLQDAKRCQPCPAFSRREFHLPGIPSSVFSPSDSSCGFQQRCHCFRDPILGSAATIL